MICYATTREQEAQPHSYLTLRNSHSIDKDVMNVVIVRSPLLHKLSVQQ